MRILLEDKILEFLQRLGYVTKGNDINEGMRAMYVANSTNQKVIVERGIIYIYDIHFNKDLLSLGLENACSTLSLLMMREIEEVSSYNMVCKGYNADNENFCCVNLRKEHLVAEATDSYLEEVWREFANTPIDEDGENIDEDFFIWKKGHDRMDIWRWFDECHSKGLAVGLMHLD